MKNCKSEEEKHEILSGYTKLIQGDMGARFQFLALCRHGWNQFNEDYVPVPFHMNLKYST